MVLPSSTPPPLSTPTPLHAAPSCLRVRLRLPVAGRRRADAVTECCTYLAVACCQEPCDMALFMVTAALLLVACGVRHLFSEPRVHPVQSRAPSRA
jgi:hypothetical protein